jgi:predicted transcriptional regulator
MVATTTLKLPDELKARIASAAQASGKAPHAFMVQALTAQTTLFERRQSFIQSAVDAEQEVNEHGLVYEVDEVFSFLQATLDSKQTEWPELKKL